MGNVELRALDEKFLPTVQRWFEDPDTRRWVGGTEWPAAQLRLAADPPERTRGGRVVGWSTLIALDGPDPVGLINFWTYDNRSTGVIVVVDPKQRRRGYGRAILEAFSRSSDLAGTTRVFAGVDPANVASVRSLEAAGFTLESDSPDELGDVYYSITRDS